MSFNLCMLKRTSETDLYLIIRRKLHNSQKYYLTDLILRNEHNGILPQFYYIQIGFRKPDGYLQNTPRITRNMHVHYVHPFYRSILLLEIQKYYPG